MCPRPFLNGYRCRKRLNPLSTFPGSYQSCSRFDRTASRSVLGSMRDFSLGVRAMVSHWGWPVSLIDLDRELAETLCGPLDYELPIEVSRQLMLE